MEFIHVGGSLKNKSSQNIVHFAKLKHQLSFNVSKIGGLNTRRKWPIHDTKQSKDNQDRNITC